MSSCMVTICNRMDLGHGIIIGIVDRQLMLIKYADLVCSKKQPRADLGILFVFFCHCMDKPASIRLASKPGIVLHGTRR